MTSYSVDFTKSAFKQLRRLRIPYKTHKAILKKIDNLQNNPRANGVEKLQGRTNEYRIRQGKYRAVYEIDDKTATVTIVRVAHREHAYT